MSHILIVDADKTLRDAYVSAFEAAGHSAAGVASAQSAIGLCEERQPDIIVLELQLQGHSGVELLQELRSYTEWQHIPVILHTLVPKSDLTGFESAFETMGIAAYAYKPETSLKQLLELAADVLSGDSQHSYLSAMQGRNE